MTYPAFRTLSKITGGFQNNLRVTGGLPERQNKLSEEASRNFIINFSKKRKTNIVQTICAQTKSTD
jgi:hypothetical protein